ncbi:alpha-hydroxy acid oxidase [Marmoricola sp. RAF53]|uniref:alpha-hydroxy acid oxidase n=1 Tax=Marmoricola sp. RAF53 TaxID=3233059 RepID=UPI003F9548E5
MALPSSGGSWLASLEDEACRVLPPEVYGYYRQGARDGTTAAEAVAAWERYRLVPRVLTDTRAVDLTTSFLGTRSAVPFGVAPTTLQRAADPGGEVAMARACAAHGVPMVLSSNATATFAEIDATGATWWLQAYLPQDRELARPMLESAVEHGAGAIVLTVDTPVVGTKYDDGAIWSATPPSWLRVNLGPAADAPKARDLGPADFTWLHEVTGLPVVAKGVLSPGGAAAVVVAGAAAVWVSNHGGRQLDRAAATADCLAPVVDRVDGAVPVYVDGGVRSGITALTALALGADAFFLGRLPLYALAVAGTDGVGRLFSTLTDELTEALVLAGCPGPEAARGVARAAPDGAP